MRAGVREPERACWPPLIPGVQRALTWRPPASSNLVMSSAPTGPPGTGTRGPSDEASRSCRSVAWSPRAEGTPPGADEAGS